MGKAFARKLFSQKFCIKFRIWLISDRYLSLTELLLNNEDIRNAIDLKKVLELLDSTVHPKNSLTKGEKIFLQNAYTHNLIILISTLVANDQHQ